MYDHLLHSHYQTIYFVSKKEFAAQEANFHKQNYKFQYTVRKLHKSLVQIC